MKRLVFLIFVVGLLTIACSGPMGDVIERVEHVTCWSEDGTLIIDETLTFYRRTDNPELWGYHNVEGNLVHIDVGNCRYETLRVVTENELR